MSTHPYPRTSQPARTPSCTRGPSRNLVLPGSDAIAANNCASAYEQTAIRAHSAPNGRVQQRRDAANPDAHALVTRIGSFIKYVREGEHALAHYLAASASKHTKKGAAGPLFRQLRMQRQLSTPQPPRPLRQLRLRRRLSTTLVLQLCTQRRLYTPKLPRTLWQSQLQH